MPFDTIVGVSRNDLKTLQGSKTSDLLIIEESSLYIKTLEGDDTISGTSGVKDLIIYSGKDNDQVIFNAEILDSSFDLGAGNDKVEIMDFSGTIRGGLGKDSIINSDIRKIEYSLIRGDAGNDIINLANISNTIINANSGEDSISVSGSSQIQNFMVVGIMTL